MTLRVAIVGAGISGLVAAYYLEKLCPAAEIDLYERQNRTGGVIRTESIQGCLVEGGPDSFLTEKSIASELCNELGLELVGSNDEARATYIYDEGELKKLPGGFVLMVPTNLRSFLTTGFLSWPGKFEGLRDLFTLPDQNDVSVADFISRRFGTEILQKLAEPLMAAVYGADVQNLSMEKSLPKLWELQKKGSLMISFLKAPKNESKKSLFTSVKSGMSALTDALEKSFRHTRILLESPVKNLVQRSGKWIINDSGYDHVIVAGGFPESSHAVLNEIRKLIASIRKNSAVVIVSGFDNLKREGFGWIVPKAERRSVLACTYMNNKFPGKACNDTFVVRNFIGGETAADWIARSDEEISAEVLCELKRIAGITAAPLFMKVFRWPNAMPEYHVNYSALLTRIKMPASNAGRFHITGNLFGIGIPDCILHSRAIAEQIAQDS